MKNLIKILSSTLLVITLSGCINQSSLSEPEKPKIDDTLEAVSSDSLKTISDINAIAFEWQKVDDSRATGYYLYRTILGTGESQKLKRVDFIKNKYTTHFVDRNLEPNTKYSYAISTATQNDIESIPTNAITAQTLPIPDAISFVQAISNLPRQIKILWRPHESERISMYKIQRTTPYTSKWEDLDSVEGRLNIEYIDDKLKDNVVYMYRVIAITFDKIESMPSEIVRAQTKPLPEGPNHLKATNDQPKRIILNWEPSNNADVVKYKIYSASSSNGGYDGLKIVPASTLTYEDFVGVDGAVRFYKVTSIDKDGLETALNMNGVMGLTLPSLDKPIITLAQIQGQKAILNWQPGDKRAVSYNVFKTSKEGYFASKTIKYNNINALRFEDQDIVRGVEYSYALQSVDEFGITSEKTETTSLILPKLIEEK